MPDESKMSTGVERAEILIHTTDGVSHSFALVDAEDRPATANVEITIEHRETTWEQEGPLWRTFEAGRRFADVRIKGMVSASERTVGRSAQAEARKRAVEHIARLLGHDLVLADASQAEELLAAALDTARLQGVAEGRRQAAAQVSAFQQRWWWPDLADATRDLAALVGPWETAEQPERLTARLDNRGARFVHTEPPKPYYEGDEALPPEPGTCPFCGDRTPGPSWSGCTHQAVEQPGGDCG